MILNSIAQIRWFKWKTNTTRSKIIHRRFEKEKAESVRKEFWLNYFITLKLINHTKTDSFAILIRRDDYLEFALDEIPFKEVFKILNGKKKYFCMDEVYLYVMEEYKDKNLTLDSEMIWICCYYFDAWIQCDYDWRLLCVNDAFLILEALYHAGDPKAREVFKSEIVKALLSGYLPAVFHLLSKHHLNYFNFEEIIWLFENCLRIVGFYNQDELKTAFFYVLKNKGFHYNYNDNFKISIKYLTKALEVYPDDIEIILQLGIAYLK